GHGASCAHGASRAYGVARVWGPCRTGTKTPCRGWPSWRLALCRLAGPHAFPVLRGEGLRPPAPAGDSIASAQAVHLHPHLLATVAATLHDLAAHLIGACWPDREQPAETLTGNVHGP